MKKFRRGSVIIAWVISYVLILAVPLSINLISTFQMSNALKQEAYSSSESLLYQAQNNVEVRLNDIIKIAQQIKTNSNIERFLTDLSQLDYPADEFNRIMVDLRSYQSSNSLIEQIYIIPHKADIAVSSGSVLRGAQFRQLDNTYRVQTEENEFNLRTVQDFGNVRLLKMSRVSGEKMVVGYMQTITKRVGSRYDATLLILLNQSSLMLNLDVRQDLFERPFYIINERDEIIAASSSQPLPVTIKCAMLKEQPKRFSVQLDGVSYTVMQADSYNFGWKYVMLIPDSLMMQEFNRMQSILGITTVSAIVVGAVCAVFFSRYNYLPLKDLVNIVESESGQAYERRENEFFFLREATQNLSAERQELENRLARQTGYLRHLFIIRLLKHELPDNLTVHEGCRLYDVHFVSEHFLVMAICYQSASKMNDLAYYSEKQREKQLIRENLDKNIYDGDCGFVLDIDNMQVFLLNFAENAAEDEACSRAYDAVEKSIRELEQQGVQDLIIASSDFVSGISELPHAYVDAYTTAEYCILMNRRGLNYHKDVTFGMTDEGGFYYYYYPLQVEMQLTNAIKSGDCEQAQQVLNELFRVNFDQCSVPREIAQCFMFNLTSTIIRIIYELNLTAVDDIGKNVAAIQSLLSCRSIPEIRQEMECVIVKLTDYTREQRSQNTFASEICAYIEKKYDVVDLDIPMIAEHFELTPSYLSKKFKNAKGVGLLDYINQYRVKKSAEALRSTQESIQTIAIVCGFLNCNTFIRVFKKYEGVTPGRYREINGEKLK